MQSVYIGHGVGPNVRRCFICKESRRRLCLVQLQNERVWFPNGIGSSLRSQQSWFPRSRARARLGARQYRAVRGRQKQGHAHGTCSIAKYACHHTRPMVVLYRANLRGPCPSHLPSPAGTRPSSHHSVRPFYFPEKRFPRHPNLISKLSTRSQRQWDVLNHQAHSAWSAFEMFLPPRYTTSRP